MHQRKIIILALFALIAGLSCRKPKSYPDEPIIEFKYFTIEKTHGIDTIGHIYFSFTDGDGDIGLRPGDTVAPYDTCSKYQFNFFLKTFEKRNGIYRQVVYTKAYSPCFLSTHLFPVCNMDLTLQFDSVWTGIIKDITPEGKSKSLSGDIKMDLPFLIPCVTKDTIKFKLYIVDRALHESNVVESPEYIITTQ